jgi:AcrR family transcriptional regulator
MPKAFTESEREWISDKLLEAGQKYFATFGLKKTSVEELAEAAGISKGAFYLFYESKEALFMDVVEQAEQQFRVEVLAEVGRPGPTPHARLVAVLRKAFGLWKTVPILQVFTRGDYELLARKMPTDKMQEHFQSDYKFVGRLMARCREAGIPVCAPTEAVAGLLHGLFFFTLHENDLEPEAFARTNEIFLQLVAAYCLGEVAFPERGQGRTHSKKVKRA